MRSPTFDATKTPGAGIPHENQGRAIDVLYGSASADGLPHAIMSTVSGTLLGDRTAVLAHIGALRGDIIPFQRRKRDKAGCPDRWQLFSKSQVIFANTSEGLFAVVNEDHFVDCHHRCLILTGGDKTMATRPDQHAFTRVDRWDRRIAGGRPGRHITGILFAARRVGDNKFSVFRGEIAVRDVENSNTCSRSTCSPSTSSARSSFLLCAMTFTVIMRRADLLS